MIFHIKLILWKPFKGIVNVISSYPPFIEWHVWFTTKVLYDQEWMIFVLKKDQLWSLSKNSALRILIQFSKTKI